MNDQILQMEQDDLHMSVQDVIGAFSRHEARDIIPLIPTLLLTDIITTIVDLGPRYVKGD
jgi:hypothetical protein